MGVEDGFVNTGPPLLPPEVEAVNEVAGQPLLSPLGSGLVLLGVIEGGETGRCASCCACRLSGAPNTVIKMAAPRLRPFH